MIILFPGQTDGELILEKKGKKTSKQINEGIESSPKKFGGKNNFFCYISSRLDS